MKKVVTIHQPEHMPWSGFFNKMICADHYVIFDCAQFVKGYYHNRNRVIDKTGATFYITVPVNVSDGRWRNPISMININFNQPWQKKYLGNIERCYSGFTFFYDTYSEIQKIVNQCPASLCELNIELIYFFRKILNITTPISLASNYNLNPALNSSELLLEICQKNQGTTYLSGPSGKDYLNEGIFTENNIKVDYHNFKPPIYEMNNYTPALSTLDMVMRFGPKAEDLIKVSHQ